jgi:hypothetical protein
MHACSGVYMGHIGVRQVFVLCFLKEILKDVFLFRFQLKTENAKQNYRLAKKVCVLLINCENKLMQKIVFF